MKMRLLFWLVVTAALATLGSFLHAEEPAAAMASGWNVEFRHWEQGQPALKLIRKEEGVCALTGVTGHFQGSGEQVRVYVGDDGYWYLGGTSHQEGVAADCVIVHFPSAAIAPSTPPTPPAPLAVGPSALPKPDSDDPVKILAASYSFGSQYADVTERVRTLIMRGETLQANPDCLGTDPQPGWNKALVIFCEVCGKLAIVSVGEGESVSKESILKDARFVTGQTASPQM